MFEDDIMETSIVDSLTICDEEILESSYIEVVAPSRIDLGRSRFNNLVTPKKQSTVVPKLGSPMIEDVYSPQLKQELAVSNSDTKKRIEVIEISDAELSDADTLIRPDNDSYVEDMEAQSPFRQNITNNASSCDPNSSRFPLKQINTNKQDNGVKSLNHSILERNNVGSKDSIEYASDSMEVQGPFKSVTNPETNKSKSGKSSNADESLLRAYRNILDERTICDEEILESSYIEVVAPSRIDLGRSRFNNLVTPKKQSTVVPKLGSPMIEDVYSPQLKQELAVSNSDTKKRIEVIEISDAELSDADTLIRPDNDSYVEDMEAQSPFRQNITNNASSCDPNSSRFPLKQINTNKQDNGVKSLNHSILERNNVGSKDSIEYASDSMEVQGPFKSVTNPVTNKSKSGKSSNADESLLRAYRNILDERYSVEKLTPEEKGYDEFMLSFLSSLSDKTYGLPCHPGAVFFKRHFRRTKATLARHLYYIYNEHIFDNQLPKDMPIKWSKKLTSSCGITTTKVDINPETKTERHFAYITLSKKILTTAERLRDTVLHEMCHAAVWLINKSLDSHGPVWKLWAAKATICLPELPPIKRCHNYETNYKYLYKCRDCGYVIGRSRPSDKLLNRCACGYCGGRFREETTKLESSFSG